MAGRFTIDGVIGGTADLELDVIFAVPSWEITFAGSSANTLSGQVSLRDGRLVLNKTSGVAIMQSQETGHPNYYYDVADIHAALAKVQELGGEAGDKTPVPTHGWFAACKDTEGNIFHLWQGDENAA